ncbi:MAG: C25 family cysteine peptidase, partial [Candidatus Thermoplasmatota archaeon]|nr:C25 family cysteine peptidase [Candidatus Thermoplasmatota archaeon]
MKNNKKLILRLGIILIAAILSLSSLTTVTGVEKRSITKDYELLVTKSDRSGLNLKLSTNIYKFDTIEIEDNVFDRLIIKNSGYTSEYGKVELPVISFYVAVPQEAEINLNYVLSDYKIFKDHYILPSQPPKPDKDGFIDPPFTINDSFYNKDEYYPESVVDVSPVMIMRGCRIVRVSVYPFVYNPFSRTLKFYKVVNIGIEFVGGTGEFIPARYRSIYFQPIFDAFIINSNMIERAAPNNPAPSRNNDRADLLIVVYDPFYEEILPLAEWRHQTGIETKVVKWSDIGTTAADLRNYMSNAYTNWELPPSFLLIVGDADHVPVNYLYNHPYHGTKTGTDLWYVAIDGTDYLPEIHEGRISVDNEEELTVVVNKILDYSKTPYMDVNWFDDILLAAYNEAGRYFIYTSDRIYNFLTPLGYNCNRQYQGGNPPGSTSGVISAINNGTIIANHRDHGASQNDGYSYTGWSNPKFDTTHIPTLTNGRMYPVMYSLNCDSGWFDGETDTEPG